METGTYRYVVTVTFVEVLVAVTGTSEELLVVAILDTCTPANLCELLFETTRSVVERLEPTLRRVQSRISVLTHLPSGLIVRIKTFRVFRLTARNKQLVGLYVEGQEVVLVARQLVTHTDIHACRNEVLGHFVVGHLTTEVLQTETESEVTGSHRQLKRLTVVQRNVGCHRPCRVHLRATCDRAVRTVIEVAVHEANSYTHRYVLMQFAEITEVECPLVGTNVHDLVATGIGQRYITKREIREAGTDTASEVTEVIETCEVSQVDVAHQLTQPRRVVSGDTTLRVHVRVLGRVPVLRVKICFGCYTQVTHTGCTCVRSNRQRRHRGDQRVHRFVNSQGACAEAHNSCERNKEFFHCVVIFVFCYFDTSIFRYFDISRGLSIFKRYVS